MARESSPSRPFVCKRRPFHLNMAGSVSQNGLLTLDLIFLQGPTIAGEEHPSFSCSETDTVKLYSIYTGREEARGILGTAITKQKEESGINCTALPGSAHMRKLKQKETEDEHIQVF